MKKIILAIVLFCLPLIKTEAFYCSYSEQARLKKMASNINYTYDFVEVNNTVSFKITLVNLRQELYLVDEASKQPYYYNGEEMVLDGYKSGDIIKFNVYSNVEYCNDLLYTIVITLPTYNPYYSDNVCLGLNNYSLCGRWTKHNYSYEEFVKRVTDYRESLNKPEQPQEVVDNTRSIWDIVVDYIIEYYYIPLLLIIVGCSVGIYISNKKSNMYR